MCELLGMDCNVPTDILFSFRGFSERGGHTGPHSDGWGIAFYEGRACKVFVDAGPSAHSEMARFVREFPIKSKLVVAHIRRATRGRVCLENTHPFQRELWGRTFAFAHNGSLKNARALTLGRYRPVGTTDSERAFCHLLDALLERFGDYPSRPALLWNTLAVETRRIARLGTFNYLMADARYLYVHCATKLCYLQRKAPFGVARLFDADVEVDFAKETTPKDKVVVVSTAPLTSNEAWTTFEPGDFAVFHEGELVLRRNLDASPRRRSVAERERRRGGEGV